MYKYKKPASQFILYVPIDQIGPNLVHLIRNSEFHLGTVHLIFWGGGAWVFFEKNFLAPILAKKNNLAQWHCEKNNLSPIVTQNSLIGMFEMSKSKKFSGSLRSPE